MRIFDKIEELQEYLAFQQAKGKSIGLVPTMGYLHEGHLSLIERSAADNDVTVVSVFVNPTQFGPSEDLETYPRDLERDKRLAEQTGADVMFTPSPEEMYPDGYRTYITVEGLSGMLCGKTRPIHFRGVATVVCKLLHIVSPDRAYFGQKDAQQLVVIRRMVRDLNLSVKIVGCPIVREADGLAKSSRNVYLTEGERHRAPILYQSLCMAQQMVEAGERKADTLRDAIVEKIQSASPTRIDYVEIVGSDTLEPVTLLAGRVLIALAVKFGNTRLIDNIELEV